MSSLFKNIRSKSSTTEKNKEPPLPLTPLEKLLQDAPPLKDDGRDRFFGLENFGSTCYGSSILQCLFYSISFRDQVINFPARSVPEKVVRDEEGQLRLVPTVPFPQTPEQLAKAKAQVPVVGTRAINKPEDKESQEYKKKQILTKGPLWALRYDNAASYGMKESLYTCMKDLFEAMSMNQERLGIIAPYKFYEIMRSSISETWGGTQHQDAHEFLNLLLNSVVDTVEATAKSIEAVQATDGIATENGTISTAINALDKQAVSKASPNSRWVHEIFEGTLTSETKCLTCENTSSRDEVFLDLSVDLDAHSSVTACLKRFSQEEMLRERDKFFCDNCGGLQEAEKRMKIKRLPKILALHLKRFRYTEDMQRMYKLFHRVTYPEQLRLFNTTSDVDDPDRLYELYAVVVHIGAGPYHGHYVSIIKTQERGWLLFDDELVEPVEKSFVMNFFGEKSNLACAYVLFYQETTADAVQAEQEAEARVAVAKMSKDLPPPKESRFGPRLGLMTNGHASHSVASPASPTEESAHAFPPLDHAVTAPQISSEISGTSNLIHTHTHATPVSPDTAQSKKERKLAEKELAKAEKAAAKEAKAHKKEEEAKQKQAEKADRPANRNLLAALNNQMSNSAKPIHSATPDETRLSSEANSEGPVGLQTTTSMDQTVLPAQAYSTIPTSATSPLLPTSPNPPQSPSSGGLGAFSRFRQSSRSLKHRPKFWPGSASASSSNPPVAAAGNGHVANTSVSGIPPIRPDESALEDSAEEGSTENNVPAQAIPRSATAAGDEPGPSATGDKLDRKRTSRFSLRRKGSNMLSFSNGGDK